MTNTEEKQSQGGLWRRLIEGTLLSGAFFTRYWLQIFLVLAMVLIYITNRYSCQRSMEQINRLNNRLEVVRTESIRIRGEYMSRIRESSMQRSVEEAGLDLAVQPQPPYRIEY